MKIKETLKDDRAQGQILALVMLAIGALILIVIVTLVPAVSYQVGNSVTIPTTSAWSGNLSLSGSAVNGSSIWSQVSPMISTTALVSVVAVLIATLLGALAIRNKR